MTEGLFDLLWIVDTLVRIMMMTSIIYISIYFIKYFKGDYTDDRH